MLAGILFANGYITASILNCLYNENLVKEGESNTENIGTANCKLQGVYGFSSLWLNFIFFSGVSAAFAVKLFKSWIHEKDINSVAGSLRKVGMDNRLMVNMLFTGVFVPM